MKSTSTVHYQGKKGGAFQGVDVSDQGERKESFNIIGDPGRPTMRGMLRKERSGGYNKCTILSDIIDEAMLHCMKKQGSMYLDFHPSPVDERKLTGITIYDNINDGFQGLDIDGEKNPLNLIHYGGSRHTSDEEWSQYGVGFTGASMCCSGVLTLTTRYKTKEGEFKYVTLKFNWEDMAAANIIKPESREISKEEYNKITHYGKGSVFKYTGCFNSIFSGDFKENVEQLTRMISTKYYKPLISRDSILGTTSEVKYRVFDSIGDVVAIKSIEAEIPPTENNDHPHDIFEFHIQIRRNNKGNEKVIYKEIKETSTKWHHEQIETSKFKAITNVNFNVIEKEFPNIIDTIYYKGTRVSGTDWCSQGYPGGSIVMERYGRILTADARSQGRYIGFRSQPKNGESNYHYYHLTYKHKPIGNNFSDTHRKIIDTNLMINKTPLNRILKEITRRLQASIGGETKFKKEWETKYKKSWDENKSYRENLSFATKPTPTITNSLPTVMGTTTSLSPEQKTNIQDVNRLLEENTHESANSLAPLQEEIEINIVANTVESVQGETKETSPSNVSEYPQNTVIMNTSEKDGISFKEFNDLQEKFKLCFNDGKITDFEVIKLMKNRIQMNSKKK